MNSFTSQRDVDHRSIYFDPRAEGRYRLLVMRRWPRGVRAMQDDGFLTVDAWVQDAAPSQPLLDAVHRKELTPARFMIAYVSEVSARLMERAAFYYADPLAPRGWRRESVTELQRPADAQKQAKVLDWLGAQAEQLKLTLLCYEARPADPVEEARGLYCHRVALYRLVCGEPVDDVLRHYHAMEQWERENKTP